ncbi:U1 small nuclear ribonucleo protein A [Rhizoclosmatium globosum]|uniref:U1 small nuclear ribonucleo protein A n=1 Tax=Rhizoclosmatium globosum TaxID=329046 RepID=A0A1Y2C9Z7_9FUNG|nr:U1 small nuclear ribonucleo protein A [Rhizoclosmatium globosum]|eukprot:ORY43766.1 U1 small nuclear ribonucleo protein A [Rhizoclosmatium globosum]
MQANHTLYVRNLNERVALKTLKTALEAIFSGFGEILQIRAKSNIKLRGQAFITFKEVESATKALNEVQGFPLFSLPLDIQYARDRNFIFSIEDGTLEEHKKRRAVEQAERASLPKKARSDVPTLGASGWFPGGAPMPAEFLPPNSILFIENLPTETTDEKLADLFQQIPGFKEVRLVPGKSDIAFVEYETEAQATIAKQQLNMFQILPGREMRVSYARK